MLGATIQKVCPRFVKGGWGSYDEQRSMSALFRRPFLSCVIIASTGTSSGAVD